MTLTVFLRDHSLVVAVGEWEAEHCPITPEADARARRVLGRAGLLDVDPLRTA